jgi:hypothetical protein
MIFVETTARTLALVDVTSLEQFHPDESEHRGPRDDDDGTRNPGE